MVEQDQELESGFEAMDADHRVQADIVRTLENAVRRGADRAIVEGILLGLLQSHEQHVRFEMELMCRFNYPISSSQEHQQAHDLLLKQLGDLKQAHAESRLEVTPAIVESLKVRLVEHIKAMDWTLADFLKAHGTEPSGGGAPKT